MGYPRRVPIAKRQAAALAVVLAVTTGCSTSWSLGGLPGRNEPMPRTRGASSFSTSSAGPPVMTGGGPELLGTVLMWGVVGAIVLTAEGLRRLFGGRS